ncbi:MAG: hypothetical protein HFI41_16185 [Lachnospiraceae bacterium]|nr:hypothetical protein [Lachnospiraceae bacterium]
MRAAKYHGVHHLELIDMEKPKAGPGEVLVKIAYSPLPTPRRRSGCCLS